MKKQVRHFAAAALPALAVLFASGCSVDGDRIGDFEAELKVDLRQDTSPGKSGANTALERDAKSRRASTEKEWSPTNDIPLYVEMPMAWFEETDAKMRDTKKRLLDAQGLVAQMYGKYERQLKTGSEKQAGFAKLLALVEQAREKAEKNGYPVSAGHLFIENEDSLDEKIAEIREEMKSARAFEAKDEAMFNACVEARKHARAILRQFDVDYAEFIRTWDKVKLMKKGEIRGDLVEEVKNIRDKTEIFIEEWNKPDTLRKL